MAIKEIRCDTIGDLDQGAARAIIDVAIKEAVADLDDRGADGKPRKAAYEKMTGSVNTEDYLEPGEVPADASGRGRDPRVGATLHGAQGEGRLAGGRIPA